MAQASKRATGVLATAAIAAIAIYWGWSPPREHMPLRPLLIHADEDGEASSGGGASDLSVGDPAASAAGGPATPLLISQSPVEPRQDASDPETRPHPQPLRPTLPHERHAPQTTRASDAPEDAPAPGPQPRQAVRTCIVGPGETLGAIALREYGSVAHADHIFRANRDRLRSPHALSIGQELRLPPLDD